MKSVIGVAVVLVVLVAVFPMTNSLGQGVDEQIVVGWQGAMDPVNHTYRLRMNYSDGTYTDVPMNPLPQSEFSNHTSNEQWFTPPGDVAALQHAFQADPHHLERVLGTRRNVSTVFHLFASAPVAYSISFLKFLAKNNINLSRYGGPDIPPGTVPYNQLPGGVLQIDTKVDGNTLVQCEPGQMPLILKAML